jgi:hypothetical protein
MSRVALPSPRMVGTPNSRESEAMCPVMLPRSVRMAWAFCMTTMNLGEECAATSTPPSGKPLRSSAGDLVGRARPTPG